MPLKRCIPCYGSGKVMGGGTILHDCEHCNGSGKIVIQEKDDIDILIETAEAHQIKNKSEITEQEEISQEIVPIKSAKRIKK